MANVFPRSSRFAHRMRIQSKNPSNQAPVIRKIIKSQKDPDSANQHTKNAYEGCHIIFLSVLCLTIDPTGSCNTANPQQSKACWITCCIRKVIASCQVRIGLASWITALIPPTWRIDYLCANPIFYIPNWMRSSMSCGPNEPSTCPRS